jgi:shikimate kinase
VNSKRVIHNIALVGFMGTGKTSVGRLLAERSGFEFVDTDELIESRAGKKIAEIFEDIGEAAFRQLEKQVVSELADRSRLVISCGGGLAVNQANLDSLKTHALVVCLWAAPDKIWSRVRHQTHRPLLHSPDPQGTIKTLLAQREPFYRQADVIVNTDQRPVKAVAQLVFHHFESAGKHTR